MYVRLDVEMENIKFKMEKSIYYNKFYMNSDLC